MQNYLDYFQWSNAQVTPFFSSIETGELLETVSIIFASYHVIFGKRGDKANTDYSIFLDANSNFPIRLKAKTGKPCLCRTGFPGFRGAQPAPFLRNAFGAPPAPAALALQTSLHGFFRIAKRPSMGLKIKFFLQGQTIAFA